MDLFVQEDDWMREGACEEKIPIQGDGIEGYAPGVYLKGMHEILTKRTPTEIYEVRNGSHEHRALQEIYKDVRVIFADIEEDGRQSMSYFTEKGKIIKLIFTKRISDIDYKYIQLAQDSANAHNRLSQKTPTEVNTVRRGEYAHSRLEKKYAGSDMVAFERDGREVRKYFPNKSEVIEVEIID